RDDVSLDDVEEDARDRVPPVEQLLERGAGQNEQERPLAGDRGHRRRTAVDETLVAERLPRASQADEDASVAANEDLLDGTVDRQVAGRRGRPLGDEDAPGRAPGVPPRGEEAPE